MWENIVYGYVTFVTKWIVIYLELKRVDGLKVLVP